MKTARKVLLLVLCAALLVSASVMGTYAYLTSSDSAVNTFSVGDVDITLDEAKVDANGKEITGEGAERVKANEYHLLPGGEYDKDPTVTVLKGSEVSYVRMLVTVSNIESLKTAFPAEYTVDGVFLLQNLVKGWDNAIWLYEGYNADTATYEFRYKSTVTPAEDKDTVLEPLFTDVIIPGTIVNDDLAKLEKMEITVVAQAIQKAGFNDADEAWAEWK